MAVSALSFGSLGWLVAHAATDSLVSHTHHGAHAPTHPHLPAALLLVGCLASGSLLAVFAGAVSGRHRFDRTPSWSRPATARRASLLSTGAFVAAEFIEHAVTGRHDVPPIAVLLLGCAIHALLGAAASALWGRCVHDVLRLAELLRGGPVVGSTCRVPRAVRHRHIPVRSRWALPLAGRAPPLVLSA
jgi:hypothetical protein